MEFGDGPFWVYVLENSVGRFYVGSTDDLARRVDDHNSSEKILSKYTHKNGPWKLIWAQRCTTRSEAMIRERSIKSMKSARWIRENLLNW
ncbi:MAG: GIY-YIG nuclease family protein [Planctomycetota bacterium]